MKQSDLILSRFFLFFTKLRSIYLLAQLRVYQQRVEGSRFNLNERNLSKQCCVLLNSTKQNLLPKISNARMVYCKRPKRSLARQDSEVSASMVWRFNGLALVVITNPLFIFFYIFLVLIIQPSLTGHLFPPYLLCMHFPLYFFTFLLFLLAAIT